MREHAELLLAADQDRADAAALLVGAGITGLAGSKRLENRDGLADTFQGMLPKVLEREEIYYYDFCPCREENESDVLVVPLNSFSC